MLPFKLSFLKNFIFQSLVSDFLLFFLNSEYYIVQFISDSQ